MNKKMTIAYVLKDVSNIKKELTEISKKHNLPIDDIDFSIDSFSTFILDTSNKLNEPILIEDINQLYNDDIFQKKEIKIIQTYNIVIDMNEDSETNLFPDFKFKLALKNKEKTQLCLLIERGSVLRYVDNFQSVFFKTIQKKLLKSGVLLGIFDDKLKELTKDYYATLKIRGDIHFDEEEKPVIVESMLFKNSINDKIILHYKNKKHNVAADRNFIASTLEGDIIVEYIKAKDGSVGRDCFGNYIAAEAPIIKYINSYTVDDNLIATTENEDKILYTALASGYVTFKDKKFSITKESTVERLNFKETGSVDTHIEADIILNVTEKKLHDDAIGAGSYIKVTELKTEGFVGQKAQIEAKNVELNSSIHKTAVIRCDNANIKSLKGTLYCSGVANIDLLEGGTVYADKVFIKHSFAGKIYANEIYIENLGPKNQLFASMIVEIDFNSSEDNKILIDTDINHTVHNKTSSDKIETVEDKRIKLHKLEKENDKLRSDITSLLKYLKDNTEFISQLVSKINYYKSKKQPVPKTFQDSLKKFQNIKEKISNINVEIITNRQKIDTIIMRIEEEEEKLFNAYVLLKGRWYGHNKITFKTNEIDHDLSVTPSNLFLGIKYSLNKENEHFMIVEKYGN